jgi:hypothetical protein
MIRQLCAEIMSFKRIFVEILVHAHSPKSHNELLFASVYLPHLPGKEQ